MSTVLIPLAEGFEEIEALAPVDLLRRAGVHCHLASLAPDLEVVGRNGIVVRADGRLADCLAASWDLVFLPGGPGTARLRADRRLTALVAAHAAAGRPVAAICAAPTVLLDLGLLEGRAHTAHPSVASELATRLADRSVVDDGPIVTGRDAGAALEFGLALVRRLAGDASARSVAVSIGYAGPN